MLHKLCVGRSMHHIPRQNQGKRVLARCFANYDSLFFSRAQVADKINTKGDQFIIQFNLPMNSFNLECSNETTLHELRNAILEKSSSKQCVFLTPDKTPIALSSSLADIGEMDYFAVVDDQVVIRVNNQFSDSCQYSDNDIEQDIASMRAPYFYTKIVGSYLQRLEKLNKKNLDLSQAGVLYSFQLESAFDEKSSGQAVNVNSLLGNMLDSLADPKLNYAVDIKVIQDRLQDLTARHSKLSAEKSRIMKIAERRAKVFMSLGLFGLVGHLGFVSIGTYYVWSWDIVEPLAYFITLSTSTVLASQYFKLKADFENTTYFRYLSEKQFKKIASKYGFDVREYEAITEEINQLKSKLKYSLLIDL